MQKKRIEVKLRDRNDKRKSNWLLLGIEPISNSAIENENRIKKYGDFQRIGNSF